MGSGEERRVSDEEERMEKINRAERKELLGNENLLGEASKDRRRG